MTASTSVAAATTPRVMKKWRWMKSRTRPPIEMLVHDTSGRMPPLAQYGFAPGAKKRRAERKSVNRS